MSSRLIKKMKETGTIKPQEEEIYAYGLEILKLKLIAGITAIIIGLILNTVLFLICFLVILIPIRKYAGGAHASSRTACMCITELIMLGAELVYKYIELNIIFMVLFVLVGIIAILCRSPYYSVNHPLTNNQIRKYRRLSICISMGFTLLFVVMVILDCPLVQNAISMAFCSESILLMIPTKSGRYRNG